jgi:DtxR family Mn-dependent transcriptional regulator
MVERVARRLGNPERCPHGWPVDPDVEQAENEELKPLAELAEGARATIVRLAEHDGDLLHWFYDQGFEPGRKLQMTAAEPAAGRFRVKLGNREETIAEKAAAGLFVRPS